MLVVAVLTIVTWVTVTLLTTPEDAATLDSFFQKVRPGGRFWGPVRLRNPDVEVDRDIGLSITAALFSTGIVYFTLPGIGLLIFGHYSQAAGCGIAAVVCVVVVAFLVRKLLPSEQPESGAGLADHESVGIVE